MQKHVEVSDTNAVNSSLTPQTGVSDKTKIIALLLIILLGPLGAHRFYVGKIGSAVLFLITLGGLGIWWLVDLYKIITDQFTDKQGRILLKKNEI